MVAFFICLAVFLGVAGGIGAILASDEGIGWPKFLFGGLSFTAFVAAVLFGYCGIHLDNHNRTNRHMQALSDLHQDGWSVPSNHIHIVDGKVTINCLKLDLKKFGGRYQVAVKRDKNAGGGYTILQPKDTQNAFVNLCVNKTTDNKHTTVLSMAKGK